MVAYLLEHNRYLNVLGIATILGIAWFFSRNRAKIDYRLIVKGILLQLVIGLFVLKTQWGHDIFATISDGITGLYRFAQEGIAFVFGGLADPSQAWGFVFAFNVLPIIIFFGALMAILYHLGIIQLVVRGIAYVVRPVFGTSGAETLSVIANSFMGQTEAPLLVRHYLAGMTRSEIMTLMVSGMAHVSGSILVVYAAMGIPAKHLLAASIMAMPGTMVIAKMLVPETEKPQTAGDSAVVFEKPAGNVLGSIAHGTTDGLQLAMNVGAMLIAFISLIALLNALLGWVGVVINLGLMKVGVSCLLPTLNLGFIFSYVFAPFSYLLGFTGEEALKVGDLLGTKLTINELVAYGKMVKFDLSERTAAIVTYALCGFANFSSIGIQIGGIGSLVPSRRAWLTELGLIALLGGSLSNLLSAMIAALLI